MAPVGHAATAVFPAIPTASSAAVRPHAPARAARPDTPTAAHVEARRDPQGLTEEERQQVAELKARDREVRAHEQAHKNAGGPYASAPTYEYTRGPDGKQYAVSGEVKIDASPIPDNPAATIQKMEVVIRAALAPAEPSSQDAKVAAQARAEKTKAQIELREENASEQSEGFAALRERLGLEIDAGEATSPAQATQAYEALSNILETQSRARSDIFA